METSKFILYILKMLGSFIITGVIKKQLCGEGDETAEQKDVSSPLLTETPKSQLTAEQPSTKNAGTYQKRYLTSKDKE